MKEVIERCNWLVNKCEDKAITPDVKDDVRYLLEEIERLKEEYRITCEQKNDYISTLEESLNIAEERYLRLNNIINELEEYICAIEYDERHSDSWQIPVRIHNKLKELKEGDKE